MLKPNPTILGSIKPVLTATNLKAIGCKTTSPPRHREAGEAANRVVCNASTNETYRTGQGEVYQPTRAGSMEAYRLRSVGIEAT